MEFMRNVAIAFEHGGIWMWLILAFKVASIAIIIERAVALFGKRKTGEVALVNSFEENVRRGEFDVVMQKAEAAKATSPVARAVAAGAAAARNFGGREEIQGKMDEVLLHENALLDKRVGFLAMLGNVATLTGLLGTISGMIKSFAAVAGANAAEKASLLAAGIAEAMNATAFGLIVAIPALVAYAIYQNRINVLAEDMNQAALKAFNWLSFSYDPISTKAQVGKTGRQAAREPELNA
ncbi:MAG: MotA/TolQ/ExbB proton channel family protein [Bdellovibrionales bacterium]|jgi:biopolymer transport protein ExbB/TolQ|nr:MotA/TolQ/ExbB proton channel family protein [Bdellovibrionales bacterium]